MAGGIERQFEFVARQSHLLTDLVLPLLPHIYCTSSDTSPHWLPREQLQSAMFFQSALCVRRRPGVPRAVFIPQRHIRLGLMASARADGPSCAGGRTDGGLDRRNGLLSRDSPGPNLFVRSASDGVSEQMRSWQRVGLQLAALATRAKTFLSDSDTDIPLHN
jgi:hypothetical protein